MSTKQSAGGHPHDHVVEGLGITPLKGHLVPLKTKGEIRASNELIDVYVVELPARSANAVLSILRSALPADTTTPAVDIQHLRRVIKPSFLPPPALALLTPNRINAHASSGETRFLLVCPTTQIAPSDLSTLLSAHPPFKPTEPSPANDETTPAESAATPPSSFPLAIHTLPVPALAPTSAPQADGWTATYWPVAYKHTNPYGPHPSLVSRAAAEVSPHAGTWLALAECGAAQAVNAGMTGKGAAVGAVVVERRLDGNGRAVQEGRCVAVAGDGRSCGILGGDEGGAGESESEGCGVGSGNVMAHAVMRAIGMVALKRLRLEEAAGKSSTQAGDPEEQGDEEEKEQKPSRACCDPVEPVFAVQPRTEVERTLFERDDNLSPNGYLCVDLEIYLTHEPCVMCSMAILHSRFNRVVFNRRMPRSGGMTADEHGVGHGLFWRPAELNWKFLCWEFVEDDEGAKDDNEGSKLIVDDGINA